MKINWKSFTLVAFILILGAGSGFVLGMQYQKNISPIPQPNAAGQDFSIVWEAWNELDAKYVKDLGPEQYKKMIYGAAQGMVAALDDPYTVFLEPENAKMLEEDISGEFQGIGTTVDIKDKQLIIASPIKGTPADKAGLKPGDKILKINGTSTLDLSIDEAVKMIRGKKGTEVALTILRGEAKTENIKEIKIIRDVINIPSVEVEVKKDSKGQQIADVKIYQFSNHTIQEFQEKMQPALDQGARKVIIDVRNNPGGLLDEAQGMAQFFLKKGNLIVTEGKSKIMEEEKYIAPADGPLSTLPIVVLINQGSASASEILAAALKDNGRATLVGETTFGKGSVQMPLKLRENAMLKLTIAQWLTPKGEVIDKKGITPDIEVKISEDDIKNEKDPQLDKAIEILSEIK